ncbi:MAG: hypothetical protein Q4Q04_05620 [Methanocorpusculum sp.]|nr:hypothetical protein [Methanocorpusculum sp.]
MNFRRAACLGMALLAVAAFCVWPASAAGFPQLFLPEVITGSTVSENETTDAFVPGSNTYGYLTVESVNFTLVNTDSEITVMYSVDPWISFLVYLFGKQDLKKRVLAVLNYPDEGYSNQAVTFKYVDAEKAVLRITNTALDNQDNSYWFKAHSFGCTIPSLSFILSASDVKVFTNVQEMAKGIGFFKTSFTG